MKLRKAKDYLKEYYCIDPKYEAYAETDIMLAVHYIDHIAEQLQRPIVIFLGIGTNLASHLGTGPLDQYLSGRAMLRESQLSQALEMRGRQDIITVVRFHKMMQKWKSKLESRSMDLQWNYGD